MIASSNSDSSNAVIAFNVIAMILLIAAAVLYLILWFACNQRRRIFMIAILGLLCLAFILLSISTGISYGGYGPYYGTWLMASTWMTIMATIVLVIFYFEEPSTN
ncbi:uncharacterized protein DEA37_0004020 [Paragonimus westermani]|uniref:Uncharacterized protein n=1 Tax=Paragonimus westermani TaxID=34504 RepID=A0A5J4N4V7_9TREM|nr:uncharacterized protein DEA37_0004020 [Paragonimus westermani]